MAVWAPGDYLGAAVADYGTIELSIAPHEVMTYMSNREQQIIPLDDGEIRIDLDDDYVFYVDVQWKAITYANATIILDILLLEARGNGITRTVEWNHPTDTYKYVIRNTKLPSFRQYPPDLWDIKASFKLMGTV